MKKRSAIVDLYLRILIFITTCGLLSTIGSEELRANYATRTQCTDGKLVITGYRVKFSDIKKIPCYTSLVEIFALDEIVIDADYDRSGSELQLAMIAPTFRINGKRSIKLNGIKPDDVFPAKAGVAGKAGKAGQPGWPAGSFVAIGHYFVNDKNLKVYVNGGDGGNGQHGANGSDGIKGQDPPLANTSERTLDLWQNQAFAYRVLKNETTYIGQNIYKRLQEFYVDGKEAFAPGNGGDGGIGGMGGYNGEVIVYGLGTTPNFTIFDHQGANGLPGKGGAGGDGTSNGVDLHVQYIDVIKYDEIIDYGIPSIYMQKPNGAVRRGNDGKDGASMNGLREPKSPNKVEVAQVINRYKYFAREYLALEQDDLRVIHFLNDMDGDYYIREMYDTAALVDEMYSLESHYHSLKCRLSFIPMLSSLLDRITEHTNQRSNPYDNWKILSYLYAEVKTKLLRLSSEQEAISVFNFDKFFELVRHRFSKLKESDLDAVRNDFRQHQKSVVEINRKIALGLIQQQLAPQIEAIFMVLDDDVYITIYGLYNQKPNDQEHDLLIDPYYSKQNWKRLDVKYRMLDSPSTIYSVSNATTRKTTYATYIYDLLHEIELTLEHMSSSSYFEHRRPEQLYYDHLAVQTNIREIRNFFDRVRQRIPFALDVLKDIDYLDRLFDILLDIYKRMIDYNDRYKTYSDITNFVSESKPYTSDEQLNKAVIDLKKLVKRNFALDQYEALLQTFKQHAFPIAPSILPAYILPEKLELSNDIDVVVERIQEMVDYLRDEYEVQKYDRDIYSDVEFASHRDALAQPFYVWNHSEFSVEIRKLLNGEKVYLYSDILGGINENAVKFSEIGIRFKASNEDVQWILDGILDKMHVTMELLGESHYRCNNRIYSIPNTDNIVIDYSFKKRDNGQPVISNNVYKRLSQNQPYLSPYAYWAIQLRPVNWRNDKPLPVPAPIPPESPQSPDISFPEQTISSIPAINTPIMPLPTRPSRPPRPTQSPLTEPTEPSETTDTTEEPCETEAEPEPGMTEEPCETESTETTEEPCETESTETTDEPCDTESTETTEEPCETESTETTEEPCETESTETTDEPCETESAESTEEPCETESTETTDEPCETQSTESTEEPCETETDTETTDEPCETESTETTEEPCETETETETTDEPCETESTETTEEPCETEEPTDVMETEPPTTQKPKPTKPAQTKPPQTKPPQTKPPVTKPPQTRPPQTKPPVTIPPQTKPPMTKPPVTKPPQTTHEWNPTPGEMPDSYEDYDSDDTGGCKKCGSNRVRPTKEPERDRHNKINHDKFTEFDQFQDIEIDLELVGRGEFLNPGQFDDEICNEDLYKHYDVLFDLDTE